ncbi:hypothetical protein Clacol_003991 [Clathrus columnatus]|uniref:protein-tyrosine-phosphatase n=1 Tax=Clathrus columnatus TaxID=1419009 RepID=A0AAV5A5A8_9AGAM|nr:hypothetical protein Clacol_003991 [Clathrus columnatus]
MSLATTLCLDSPLLHTSPLASSSTTTFKALRLNRQPSPTIPATQAQAQATPTERTISVSKLSRALSRLNLRSSSGGTTAHAEAHPIRFEQAQYLDSLYSSSNARQILSRVSIPSGLNRDRVREFIYSIAISPKGTAFLPRYSEIIPGYLYIADSYTGTDMKTLSKLGITHVIGINNTPHFEPTLSSPSSPLSPKLIHIKHHTITPPHPKLHLPSSKKAPSYISIFDEAVDFIDEAFRDNKPRIMIHDRLGSDWSASVVIAWAIRNQRCSYDQACHAVRQRREIVSPSREVEKGVKEWMGLEYARSFFPVGRGGRCNRSSSPSPTSSSSSASASPSSSRSSASNSDSEDTFEDVIDIR